MRSCVASAQASSAGKLKGAKATNYCEFGLKCIEGKLSLKRFEQVTSNMIAGKVNPDEKYVRSCVKDSVKKVQ